EYVRNFYKIERIVKSNWDKKEGKIKYQLVVTVKLRILRIKTNNISEMIYFSQNTVISFLNEFFRKLLRI
ncbi:hypothetical protein, partial [Methanosarcina mazei]|uniref:hypothetical protein n=2 Tax=Methanosarcina mazei TaxID=2209 RepID=UPI00064E38DD